jgi:hypothetical protein
MDGLMVVWTIQPEVPHTPEPGDVRWNKDDKDILNEDGLVLRDDSLEALEMSGQEMCRLLRLRQLSNEPE